ncbi:glutamyl-tRNA reductase [Thorsellia kenyensis]|uniref:Glutamyl-tRNA reductase n=1 Tax=Thorsellia kenyensis TaxID=1549888 RepID=A0ABV6CA06_9GAMM
MKLIVLGVNHKTASVSLREQISFAPEQLSDALMQINALLEINSSLIVSTCNRTEIYFGLKKSQFELASEPYKQFSFDTTEELESNFSIVNDAANPQAWQKTQQPKNSNPVSSPAVNPYINKLIDWLCHFHQLDRDKLIDHFFILEDEQAVRHLMRVASGLDSLVLGEPQILGQVKDAYQLALETYKVNAKFSKWIEKSFSVAKRVRTETDIGANAVSVAFAACSLAKQIFENLSELNVLLIGAGETIELVSRHLKTHGVKNLLITNRTFLRAQLLADSMGAKAIELATLSEILYKADIVISSTASPQALVSVDMMKRALKQRRFQPVLLIDIAVPRDIDEKVSELDSVYLYTVDDLQDIITYNQSQRLTAAKTAELLIDEEVEAFIQWLNTQSAAQAVVAYRQSAENLRLALVEKSLASIAKGADPVDELEKLSKKLTNKLIHTPTIALKNSTLHESKIYFSQLSKDLKLTPP